MIRFAIFAVFSVIIIGAIFGAIRSHDNGIRADQKAKDQVVLVACQTNEKIATDANLSLQASIEPIKKQRDEQSAEVLAWKGLADRAATVAQNNLDANKSTLAQLDATRRDAQAKARRPAQTMTCEQTLAEIDKDSKEFASARAILFPPEKSPDAMRVK